MKRKLILYNLMIVIALLLYACDETIIRTDCDQRNDISLTLTADYFTECHPTEILPAGGTSFRIISGTDTIISGNLGADGRFETGPIDSTGCGLSNVVVEASYNGKSIREEFGILCCDTTLSYTFGDINCDSAISVECESLDTTIVRNITSSGDCILVGAHVDELKNNAVIIFSDNPLRVDLTQLLSLTGKITLDNLVPEVTGNEILLDNSQLEIYFNVDRSTVDTIAPVTIKLPVYCLDSLGNDQNSGTITIIVSATVCDPYSCLCPFSDNASSELFYADESVSVGENKTFNFTLFTLSEGVFSEGCLLKIDSISRSDGSNAYQRGTYSWIIENQTLPTLSTGEKFSLDANFAPTMTGEITEEFIVYTSVYSESDVTNRKNETDCTFHFKLRGSGCSMTCPQIQLLGKIADILDGTGTKIKTIYIGTKVNPEDGNIISQELSAKMTTDCLKELEQPAISLFNVLLPDGYYCSDLTLSVEENVIGTYDDRELFVPVLTKTTLNNENKNSQLALYFNPPDLEDHYNSSHSNVYQCDFILNIYDEDGTLVCQQEFQITAEVSEFSLSSGDVIPMQAFSQVSAADENPSYHVYDIDEYNSTLGNYGLRESLTTTFVNYSTTPNTPLSSHTLYFDVDSPEDTVANLTQSPKFYLINTSGNNFSMASSISVASYPTPDDFFSDYENGNLMNTIFSNQTIDKDKFSYEPNRSKDQFSSVGGIDIHPFEVFIVWDSSAAPDVYSTNSGVKRVNCGMALIYISSVKTGKDNFDTTTGGNAKASVSFYVVYPVKY